MNKNVESLCSGHWGSSRPNWERRTQSVCSLSRQVVRGSLPEPWHSILKNIECCALVIMTDMKWQKSSWRSMCCVNHMDRHVVSIDMVNAEQASKHWNSERWKSANETHDWTTYTNLQNSVNNILKIANEISCDCESMPNSLADYLKLNCAWHEANQACSQSPTHVNLQYSKT